MSDTVVLQTSPVAGQQPGDVVAGKYRLERELGRGAMGTVWSAMHVTLGQRVAIKLIASDQSRSLEARQRFSVEAKAAARLRSRHVVQVYDDGEMPDGTPYIVMEYLEGKTLEERLIDQDVTLGEAVRITSHVGRALARAHAQGIVHRDLKSGNIFIAVSEDDELGWVAKVLDFGVAKVLTDSSGPSATKTGTIVGTPLFMSPEQIRGASHVDHRADLYSLGMVFYNMVTGSHAYDGPSYSDVLVAICTEVLPDIRTAAPWLPPKLGTWFEKACARERDDRFQTADEMIDALQEAAGPGARMTRPSVPEEIGGPSGTLVGYAPPHSAKTILAGEVAPVSAVPSSIKSPPRGSEQAHSDGGTLRSRPPSPLESTGGLRAELPKSNLVLWGASGAGLAVVATLLLLLTGRSAPDASDAARAEAVPATPAALPTELPRAAPPPPVSLPSEPAAARAPSPVAANLDPPAAVAAPPATAEARRPSHDASSASSRHSAGTPRRSATPRVAAAPAAPKPTSAPRPAQAASTPDMGF